MAQVNLDLVLRGVTSATDAINQFTKKTEGALSSIKSLAAGLVVGAAFVKGLEKSIDAAVESEKAVIRLNNSLRLTGDFTEETSRAFEQFAGNIEKTTAITDEAILGQVSYVKSLGATNDQAKNVVSAAVDLSAALGVSLDTAVQNLTATYSGFAGLLSRQIPELKNFTKEQLASGAAVDLIANKFSGTAQNNIQGFSGQLSRLKIAFSNVFEETGKLIIQNPVIIKSVQLLADGFQFLADIITKIPSFLNQLDISVLKTGKSIVDFVNKIPGISGSLNGISGAINNSIDIRKNFDSATNSAKSFNDILSKSKSNADGLGSAVGKTNQQIESAIEQLKGQVSGVSGFELKSIKDTEKERISLINDAVNRGLLSAKDAAALRSKVEIDFATKTAEAQKKLDEERAKRIQDASKNPLSFAISNGGINNKDEALASGVGVVGSALKGSQGATDLITGALGSFADTILPGIGGVVSQIAGVLAQGPEAAKGFINGFVDSIPTVIQAITDSIPVVVETLAQRAPDIITALTLAIPRVANKLAIELGLKAPEIARDFTVAFIKEGIPAIVRGFIDEIKSSFQKLNPFSSGGGGIGEIAKTIGTGGLNKVFGFADGGIVPGVGTGDKVPSLLTPGEAIVDRSVSGRLLNFLDNFESSQNQPQTQQQPQNLSITLNVGEEQLSQVLLNLNRQGFRTA